LAKPYTHAVVKARYRSEVLTVVARVAGVRSMIVVTRPPGSIGRDRKRRPENVQFSSSLAARPLLSLKTVIDG